jgi:chemotaxis family two-component system sensor kinase Cph1
MTRSDAGIQEANAALAFEPPRVLLAEDHGGSILVITTFLDMHGYDYEVARSGEEAVQKATSHQYTLMLMDVKMPGIDGLEATRRIREFERKNSKQPLPIIGVTACALNGDKERCIEAGMDDYIAKPVDISYLKEKLNMAVSKSAT